MKKTILVVMIIVVAMPCFAKEVKPESIFSVEGTLWGICAFGIFSIPPFVGAGCGAGIGFYQGKMYLCTGNNCESYDTSSYNDLVVVSIAYYIDVLDGSNWTEEEWGFLLAIMQPIGVGVFSIIGYSPGGGGWVPTPRFLIGAVGIMFKINDNWTPPEVE